MRLAVVAALLVGFTTFQTPGTDPASLRIRDSHQGILIACDPYSDAARAKKEFGKESPLKAGILPLEVYVRNGARWPVAVSLDKIRLDVVRPGEPRDSLDPLSSDYVATLILHPKSPGAQAPRPRLPIPLPGIGKGGKWRKLRDKLDELAFPDAVVAPGATVHGFFYFNLAGEFSALRYARFYVPDLKFLGNAQSIMFFEADFSSSP